MRLCALELKLNLDIHLRPVRLQQGVDFFRQEPGHLDTGERKNILRTIMFDILDVLLGKILRRGY